MNSFVRGASRNIYSGVTTFCRFASAWGSLLAVPTSTFGAATLVMGSPWGFVFCSASSASLMMTPLGYMAQAVRSDLTFTLHLVSRMAEGSRAGCCLLYTSDAADERSSVDLGGRRIIK